MILFTGFKGRNNSSCRLMDFFEGETLLLTNSFAGLPCENAARKAFEAEGICCTVSENTSKYLCNEAYFYMLEKFSGKALFFHIPPLRYMTDQTARSIVRAVNNTAIGVMTCDTQSVPERAGHNYRACCGDR